MRVPCWVPIVIVGFDDIRLLYYNGGSGTKYLVLYPNFRQIAALPNNAAANQIRASLDVPIVLQIGANQYMYQTSCVQGRLHSMQLSQAWDPLSSCATQKHAGRRDGSKRQNTSAASRLPRLATLACAPTVVELIDCTTRVAREVEQEGTDLSRA